VLRIAAERPEALVEAWAISRCSKVGRLPGELPLEFVDAGLDCGSVDSIGDLTGLAVKRLPRLLSVVRHLGDVAVSAAEDDKGAGDPLRDSCAIVSELTPISIDGGSPMSTITQRIASAIEHVSRGIVHRLPPESPPLEKVPKTPRWRRGGSRSA